MTDALKPLAQMTPEEIVAADLMRYSYDDVKAAGESFRSAEKKLFERWADGWSIN